MNAEQKNSLKVWIGAFVVLILGVWGLTLIDHDESKPVTDNGEAHTSTVTVGDNENYKGGVNAPITIVEYSDFQCPVCKQYLPVINQMMDDYPNDVRFVYRHFPLRSIHSNAQIAAEAVEAAGHQDKFFEMHDIVLKKQAEWSDANNPVEFFVGYASELGLDVDQFKTNMNSSDVINKVNSDYDSAVELGLNGTPSFFINGQRIENPAGFEPLRRLIDAELERVEDAKNSLSLDGGSFTINGEGEITPDDAGNEE